jgi:hypothetical protein
VHGLPKYERNDWRVPARRPTLAVEALGYDAKRRIPFLTFTANHPALLSQARGQGFARRDIRKIRITSRKRSHDFKDTEIRTGAAQSRGQDKHGPQKRPKRIAAVAAVQRFAGTSTQNVVIFAR